MAEVYIDQRRDLASRAVDAATDIVRGVQTLVNLGPELAQKGGGFADEDFAGTNLAYLNAWKLNNLVNIVAPALQAVSQMPIAEGASVTHRDILYAVKRA